jgi:hypothetical protein
MKTNWLLPSGVKPEKVDTVCETCAIANQVKKQLPACENEDKKTSGLVCSDIMDPVTPNTISGNQYTVTLIMMDTRFIRVYLMKKKDEMLQRFKDFQHDMNTQVWFKVKTLRSDNGGEYRSHAIKDHCKKNGIRQECTNSHNPEQNGMAEKANHTLVEMSRCIAARQWYEETWPKSVSLKIFGTVCHMFQKRHAGNRTALASSAGSWETLKTRRDTDCCKRYKQDHTFKKYNLARNRSINSKQKLWSWLWRYGNTNQIWKKSRTPSPIQPRTSVEDYNSDKDQDDQDNERAQDVTSTEYWNLEHFEWNMSSIIVVKYKKNARTLESKCKSKIYYSFNGYMYLTTTCPSIWFHYDLVSIFI